MGRNPEGMKPNFGPSYCNVTCRCGHTADLSEFDQTPVNGDLPAGTFQCPKCKHAWTYRAVGTGRLICGGTHWIPPDRVVETVPSRL